MLRHMSDKVITVFASDVRFPDDMLSLMLNTKATRERQPKGRGGETREREAKEKDGEEGGGMGGIKGRGKEKKKGIREFG